MPSTRSGNFIWLRADNDRREALVRAFAAADVLVRGYPGDGIRITLADAVINDRVLAVLTGSAGSARVA